MDRDGGHVNQGEMERAAQWTGCTGMRGADWAVTRLVVWRVCEANVWGRCQHGHHVGAMSGRRLG